METSPLDPPEVSNQVPPAESSDELSKESPDTSPLEQDTHKQNGDEGLLVADEEKQEDKDEPEATGDLPTETSSTDTKASKETQPSKVSAENTPKEPEPRQVPQIFNNGGGNKNTTTPFQPWYKTLITDAVKDGENIIFTVETTKLDVSSKHFKVERIYEDFEWLHHCLTTENNIGGLVIPPLPLKPVATAADTAAKSRKELGEHSKTLKGDEFEKDMRRLEKYISTVIRHQVFGRDMVLAKFLSESNPPVRAKLRKSILDNLSKAMEGVLKGVNQDVDESFQKYRLNASNMVPLAKDMNSNFQGMVNHSERLSGALNHFSTALCLVSSANSNKTTAQMNELQLTFARSMEHLSHTASVFATNDERTLGFTLDLYSKYAEAVKETLGRRTVKLYEFNSAVKTYDKAKPLKKQAAERSRTNEKRNSMTSQKLLDKSLTNTRSSVS
ncbi:hypothetical protein BSL78_13221 [Apostichopus japonicus]|uniref:PX domain-containing protein n=1 Tax=Stichopus japonicus TaxID=307972 RepID=A0A2G8KPG4_STIJA|nr:hypothetical protein BSL78_13221 [Apostichopus japonicus]